MKIFALLAMCACSPSCALTVPLGGSGEYGEVYALGISAARGKSSAAALTS